MDPPSGRQQQTARALKLPTETWPEEQNVSESSEIKDPMGWATVAEAWGDVGPQDVVTNDPTQEDVPPNNATHQDAAGDDDSDGYFSPIEHLGPKARENEAINRVNLYEMETRRNTELHTLHTVQFELTYGDTVVYVDLPNRPKSPRKAADCCGIAFRSQMFRVHSDKLLATGSPKFAQMLGPTYQHRILRRRKLVNNLPTGIKYVLDMTPPSEGDDLVFQMMELSLTPGIINWWTAEMLHGVDPTLVLGHDDVCTCKRQPPSQVPAPGASTEGGASSSVEQKPQESQAKPPKKEKRKKKLEKVKENLRVAEDDLKGGQTKVSKPPTPHELLAIKQDSNPPELYHIPEFRKIPDYCPFRHCAGIVRLLMLIEGHNVFFDSAVRVWTMVALAKIFDCTDAVQNHVAQWILQGNNSRFIEVLPEESLRIGYALKLSNVTQGAFRILVNELALHEADGLECRHKYLRTTIFGRKIEDCIDDELSNMIQHAARALSDRITILVGQFQSPLFFDDMNIREWSQLRQIELLLLKEDGWDDALHHARAVHTLQRLMKALVHLVSWQFCRAVDKDMSNSASSYETMDSDRATYVLPESFEKLHAIIHGMTQKQRFLLPFVYSTLGTHFYGNVFAGQTSKHEESRNVPLQNLVEEAEEALQEVVNENPQRTSVQAWEVAFRHGFGTNADRRSRHRVVALTDLAALNKETGAALRPILNSWIRHSVEPPLNITRHMLLTLSNSEMKFLPLWAGGCNDGTGGVFETPVPLADMGPNGPGPSFHTGMSVLSATSSTTGSLVEGVFGMNVRGSTVVGSLDAQDSISTVYRPDHVIPDDVSIATEDFTLDGNEYEEARFADPADHQAMGPIVDSLVESPADNDSMDYTDSDSETENGWSVKSDSEDAVMIG